MYFLAEKTLTNLRERFFISASGRFCSCFGKICSLDISVSSVYSMIFACGRFKFIIVHIIINTYFAKYLQNMALLSSLQIQLCQNVIRTSQSTNVPVLKLCTLQCWCFKPDKPLISPSSQEACDI